jgi:PEGA domain
MKRLLKLKRVLRAAALLFMIADIAMASDLIEPTRTLQSAADAAGSLTVLSEPPGLEVTLNDTRLGKTPVFLDRVKPGTHTLRVKDSETTIDIKPDAILRISLFKGRFINIPAAKTEAIKTPAIQAGKLDKTRPTQPPHREAGENDLTPWERFINGSSKYF